jgi:U1 zinc finger
MGDRKNQKTRHYCKACKIWIADNKAQRDQHERGARHKTASEMMLEDIARRNKERAQAEATSLAEIAKIEAKAAVAMGYPQRQTFSAADDRTALLDNIALATTAKSSIHAVPRVDGDAVGHQAHSKIQKSTRDEEDPRGYGKWEEVADTQNVVEPTDDDNGRNQKRCHEAEEFIGAQDAADREEATLRSNAGDLSPFSSTSAICAGTDSVAIEFKARNSGRAKRRRRGY